jgi:3-hydroxybutyrate dehydrogenase
VSASRRIALVTGASRGIGAAIARSLAPDHDLVLVARSSDSLQAVADGLRGTTHCVAADLSTTQGVQTLLDALGDLTGGRVDVLVNNAGIALSAPLDRTTNEQWDSTLALNLTAPFLLCRDLVPRMAERGWGRVINVVSTSALKGYRFTSSYSASKAGLMGLTRALALEVATKGVTINAVCPGFTDTDIVAHAVENIASTTGRDADAARKMLEKFSPQRRLLTPSEVGSLVAYLASDAARGINGQAMAIDGGETA